MTADQVIECMHEFAKLKSAALIAVDQIQMGNAVSQLFQECGAFIAGRHTGSIPKAKPVKTKLYLLPVEPPETQEPPQGPNHES